jgi:hypothetical protein
MIPQGETLSNGAAAHTNQHHRLTGDYEEGVRLAKSSRVEALVPRCANGERVCKEGLSACRSTAWIRVWEVLVLRGPMGRSC